MVSDQIEGKIKRGVGHIQDGAGGLIGDNGLQAKGKFNEAAGFMQDAFGGAKDQVSDIISDVKDRAYDRLDRTSSQARDLMARADFGDLEKAVAQNPLVALAAASVLGIVVGLLLRGAPNRR